MSRLSFCLIAHTHCPQHCCFQPPGSSWWPQVGDLCPSDKDCIGLVRAPGPIQWEKIRCGLTRDKGGYTTAAKWSQTTGLPGPEAYSSCQRKSMKTSQDIVIVSRLLLLLFTSQVFHRSGAFIQFATSDIFSSLIFSQLLPCNLLASTISCRKESST